MTTWKKWAIVRIILTTLYLFPGWILFTGNLQIASLITGGAFSFLIALATYFLFIDSNEASRKTLIPRIHWLVIYLLLVAYKMYISSFQVTWNILRGKYNPRIVHFRTRLSSDIARTLLATSITITPGTIAVDMQEDHMIVHWLDAPTTHSRYAGDLIKGSMEKLLHKIWN